MKKVYEKDFYGKKIRVEIGELAKQATSSVLIRYNDTVVLSAVVLSKNTNLLSDFFPLQVLYQEKLYSVGKIPGGFIKREGRPTDAATLAARMIDRPLRPLFPEDFRNEVQIVNTVLSVEQDASPELAALFGSSLATCISEIPFSGPVAGVKVGRIKGEFVINPGPEELKESDIDLTVAGTKDAINMVESSAKEVKEEDMLKALMFGEKAVKELCLFEEEIIKEIGKEKLDYERLELPEEMVKEIEDLVKEDLDKALRIHDKSEKLETIFNLLENLKTHFKEKEENKDLKDKEIETLEVQVKNIFEKLEYQLFRKIIVKEKLRPDGRKMDEIRPLSAEVDLLPRVHGSALFTRGETQALATTTLGAKAEHQILDGLSLEEEKHFILHYNFPQFCVGETGRYGSPGRREIGHGALGEKALLQVVPSEEEFPYTIRVVSEILESNGSSSQASICAGCMSLMAAGVPIKAPVAGIAMGLITEGKDHIVLTDIQGMEDHLGDMDFKVAGTKKGICALQMDIKIDGITEKILEEALKQAKKARLQVLDVMLKAIPEYRQEVSEYAPKMETFKIAVKKIKDVIGKGGDTITDIILESSNVNSVNDQRALKIDVEDNGQITLYHQNKEVIEKAKKMILDITREVEVGKIYNAKVVDIEEFGAFVEVWPGCEGLVHISKLAKERVNKVEDVVKLGDEIIVKFTGYDKKGKLNFSRKDAL